MKLSRFWIAGLIVSVASVSRAADVDFAKDIQPILEKTCLKCHGPEKPKGGLRLDSKEALLKGGKGGEIVVAGKADESSLYEAVTLPKDDPMRMPAEGEPLTKEQQDLFRDWINQGLKWPDGLVLKAPATAKPAEPVDPGVAISDAEKAAVAKVTQLNALALRLAQNTNLLRVDFSLQGKDIKDDDLACLKDMANLVELNLGNTPVTDAGLAHVKDMAKLTRLQLHKTKITDAGLANLKTMQKLQSLNLYSTEITDAGLEHLKELKGLKRLYVWQTKVTAEGAKKLQEAIPGLYINRGHEAEVAAAPKEPAKSEEKKAEEKKPEEKKEEKKQ
jgi:hypothetical protein